MHLGFVSILRARGLERLDQTRSAVRDEGRGGGLFGPHLLGFCAAASLVNEPSFSYLGEFDVLVWFFVDVFFFPVDLCYALCDDALRFAFAEVLRAAVAYTRLRYYAICTGMEIEHWVDIEIARASVGGYHKSFLPFSLFPILLSSPLLSPNSHSVQRSTGQLTSSAGA